MSEARRPLRASSHCRHYSYEPGLKGGPRCARGIDLGGSTPVGQCMPPDTNIPTIGRCDKREEYTDAERAAWEAEKDAGLERLGKAVQALPKAIPLRSGGEIKCPNCGGRLHYGRWYRGAEIRCETPFCASAHFSIGAGVDWPRP